MSYRDKIRARVVPHLPPGETYVVAFPAVGGIAPRLAHRHRVVVVTDRHVHLFSAGLWRLGDPKRLVATLPPGTVIESRPDFIYDEIHLAGERLWVMPAYDEDLQLAIAASRAITPP